MSMNMVDGLSVVGLDQVLLQKLELMDKFFHTLMGSTSLISIPLMKASSMKRTLKTSRRIRTFSFSLKTVLKTYTIFVIQINLDLFIHVTTSFSLHHWHMEAGMVMSPLANASVDFLATSNTKSPNTSPAMLSSTFIGCR